jgi:hypothetical protein
VPRPAAGAGNWTLSFAKRASDPCGEGLTGPQDAETADGSVDDRGRSEGESRVGKWGRSRALVGGEVSQAGLDYAARRT